MLTVSSPSVEADFWYSENTIHAETKKLKIATNNCFDFLTQGFRRNVFHRTVCIHLIPFHKTNSHQIY